MVFWSWITCQSLATRTLFLAVHGIPAMPRHTLVASLLKLPLVLNRMEHQWEETYLRVQCIRGWKVSDEAIIIRTMELMALLQGTGERQCETEMVPGKL